MTRLRCGQCGKDFDKRTAEYNRQVRRGKDTFYCTQSCQVTARNKAKPNLNNLRRGRVRDTVSSFRWFMGRARYRKRKGPTDLTPEYLKALWEEQGGACPFTGWLLELPKDTYGFSEHSPRNASLDRVDNSKGYVQGNVRFIALMANIARCDFSDTEVVDFCRAVVENSQHGIP